MCKRLPEEPPPGYHPVRLPGHGWVVLLLNEAQADDTGLLYVPCLAEQDRKSGLVHLRTFRGPVSAIRAAWRVETSRMVALVQRLSTQVAEPQPA